MVSIFQPCFFFRHVVSRCRAGCFVMICPLMAGLQNSSGPPLHGQAVEVLRGIAVKAGDGCVCVMVLGERGGRGQKSCSSMSATRYFLSGRNRYRRDGLILFGYFLGHSFFLRHASCTSPHLKTSFFTFCIDGIRHRGATRNADIGYIPVLHTYISAYKCTRLGEVPVSRDSIMYISNKQFTF